MALAVVVCVVVSGCFSGDVTIEAIIVENACPFAVFIEVASSPSQRLNRTTATLLHSHEATYLGDSRISKRGPEVLVARADKDSTREVRVHLMVLPPNRVDASAPTMALQDCDTF